MATWRPAAWSRDEAALPAGSVPRDHLSMPAGRRPPFGGLVVTGQQDRTQPERAQGGDRGGRRRLDRVGDREGPLTAPSQPTRTAVRLRFQVRHCTARAVRDGHGASANSLPPDQSAASSTPPAPRPGRAGSPRPGGSAPASAGAAAVIAGAMPCWDACSTAPAQRSSWARGTRARPARRTVIRPVVTVPVLSRTTTATDREVSSAR